MTLNNRTITPNLIIETFTCKKQLFQDNFQFYSYTSLQV